MQISFSIWLNPNTFSITKIVHILEQHLSKDDLIQAEISKIVPVQRQHTLVEIFSEHPLETGYIMIYNLIIMVV